MEDSRNDLRILIVDDDEKSLKVLEAKLQTIGYKDIVKASNGKEAIALVRELQPNLIFLDIVMPEMDGGSVKRELLDNERTKNIPVIFSTALITEKEAEQRTGEVAGALYIAKPYDTEKIKEAIRTALGNI